MDLTLFFARVGTLGTSSLRTGSPKKGKIFDGKLVNQPG